MSEWQPIATAPHQVIVLVFDPTEGAVAGWTDEGRYWSPRPISWESDALYPTHWMSLPEPPK